LWSSQTSFHAKLRLNQSILFWRDNMYSPLSPAPVRVAAAACTRPRLRRLVLCALFAAVSSAAAQEYPDKPVKIIVAYKAGGPMDAGARAVAAGLTKALGQPFVVENKTGAAGRIGTEAVYRSKADGYTLMYAIADQLVINPHIFPDVGYDVATAFEPVAPVGRMPQVVALRPAFSETTGQGLIRKAIASPGKVSYGSWGVGS